MISFRLSRHLPVWVGCREGLWRRYRDGGRVSRGRHDRGECFSRDSAGHDGCAGRSANGSAYMGVGEPETALGQFVNVGRLNQATIATVYVRVADS